VTSRHGRRVARIADHHQVVPGVDATARSSDDEPEHPGLQPFAAAGGAALALLARPHTVWKMASEAIERDHRDRDHQLEQRKAPLRAAHRCACASRAHDWGSMIIAVVV
jgi:hypothetical protein